MGQIEITCRIDGEEKKFEAYPLERAIDILRTKGQATGIKEGCGEGECGACAVMVDGELANSCLIPAVHLDGRDIVTVEGLANKEELHPIQKAFLECGGAQCGFCTPGMIMASYNLLQNNSRPTHEQIQEGLGGNLCRCTGYMKIFKAVNRAASETT